MLGRQSSHQHQISQQIEISGDALPRDAEIAGEFGRVQDPPLLMGKHGPEPAQRFGWDAQPERRDVALQIGPGEFFPSCATGPIRLRKITVWKTSAQPEGGHRIRTDFRQRERVSSW